MIYLFSQNIISLIKFPKIKLRETINKNKGVYQTTRIKKDPIINDLNSNSSEKINEIHEEYQVNQSKEKSIYLSPSLEILESNNAVTKKKLDEDNIKANSNLLEKVFQDFNIEIQVINVKHGPVVTLFEILPAAGIKINTCLLYTSDAADDQ